jgi:hypothetical protein
MEMVQVLLRRCGAALEIAETIPKGCLALPNDPSPGLKRAVAGIAEITG